MVVARERRRNKIINRTSSFDTGRAALARHWEGAIRDWPCHLDIGWGDLDSVGGQPVVEAITEQAPSAQVTHSSELGHYPPIEDPAAVGALVVRFVAGRLGTDPSVP